MPRPTAVDAITLHPAKIAPDDSDPHVGSPACPKKQIPEICGTEGIGTAELCQNLNSCRR
jgi:hypothetical protein